MSKILLVDDVIDNLETLKKFLDSKGERWNILTCDKPINVQEIMLAEQSRDKPVEVVITDLVMHGNSRAGMEVIKLVKKIDPSVMTILVTAHEEDLDRYLAFDEGAFDVIEKEKYQTMYQKEIYIKTKSALRFREWSKKIQFMSKYFDPKVIDAIQLTPELKNMSLRTLTIIFWDIRGFTQLCKKMKAHPKLISGFLNDYCELGAKIIFRNKGILDKFIGDGIMALFGIFDKNEEDEVKSALLAVKAAIEFREEVKPIINKWIEEGKKKEYEKLVIGLGCGIHTGEVLAGSTGSNVRDQFTAYGDPVNFTSRIENAAKDGFILISQSTNERIKHRYVTKLYEVSNLKGLEGEYELFTVESIK